jgi:hypothetical protein
LLVSDTAAAYGGGFEEARVGAVSCKMGSMAVL